MARIFADRQTGNAEMPPFSSHWSWLFTGLGLFLLGLLLSIHLTLATIASVYLIGIAMMAAAIVQLLHGSILYRGKLRPLWLLSGALYLAAAIAVLFRPLEAALFFSLVLAAMLCWSGIFRLWLAVRWHSAGRWLWSLSGGISLAVGLLIALDWPANALWVLGLFLTVDLLVQGVSLMIVALSLQATG